MGSGKNESSRTVARRRRVRTALAGCAMAAVSGAQSAAAALDRHAAFLGGRAAVAAAGDLVYEGEVRGDGPVLRYRAFVRRTPFAFRQEVFAGDGQQPLSVRITDGRYAWRPGGGGRSELLDGGEARIVFEAAFVDGLRYLDGGDLESRCVDGGTVTLAPVGGLPADAGEGGEARMVHAVPPGTVLWMYFDESTGALRGVSNSERPPMRQLRYADWRECGPLRLPMLRIESQAGGATTAVVLERIVTGATLDPGLFAGSPAPALQARLRVGELWPLPDVVPGSCQFAVPWLGIGGGLVVVAMFDTGADSVFMSTAAANGAGLLQLAAVRTHGTHGPTTGSHRWLDELRLGTFVERQLRIAATVLPAIAQLAIPHQPAMVLGGPVLLDRSPVLDLAGKSLWLRGEPVTPLAADAPAGKVVRTVPFQRRAGEGVPFVDVEVGGERVPALLDTGQGALLRLTVRGLVKLGLPVDSAEWRRRGAISMWLEGAGRRDGEDLLVRVPSVQLGPVRWEDPYVLISLGPAGAAPYEAALGGGALVEFARVGIDNRRRQLELEAGPRVRVEGDGLVVPARGKYCGLVLVPGSPKGAGAETMPRVHDVLAGTPAAAAGALVGDRVQAIDGMACAELAPRSFNERLWLGEDGVDVELVRGDGTVVSVRLR